MLFYRIVFRGISHRRPRPENSQRFGSGSLIASLTQRSGFEDGEYNWLGKTWMDKHNGAKLPSMNQIADGLITEAKLQLV